MFNIFTESSWKKEICVHQAQNSDLIYLYYIMYTVDIIFNIKINQYL